MRFTLALSLLASLLCAACGNSSPTAPPVRPAFVPPPAPPTAGPPIPGGPAASSLVFSAITVQLFKRGAPDPFQYVLATLKLMETTGRSGITLQTISVLTPSGRTDSDCPGIGVVHIDWGETLDLVPRLGYCMPYAVAKSEETQVTVHVGFVDDNGQLGAIQRTIDVSGCTLGGKPGHITCN